MCCQCLFQLALWKKIFLDVDIVVKNKSKCGLSWSIPTSTCHYPFPKHFFYCFCMLSEFEKVFGKKVWCVQVAHLHNAAHALSSRSRCFELSTNVDKDFFRYIWYCAKKQIECGLTWSVLLSTTIQVITVVKICSETIFSPDTLTKREMTIFKIYPPAIITSLELIIAEYDAILDQWGRKDFYNHLSNFTKWGYTELPIRAVTHTYHLLQLSVFDEP